MRTRCRALLGISVAVWLCGCAVGPDYNPPAVEVPKFFGSASIAPALPGPPGAGDFVRWWQTLHDPLLTALIERAIASNLDIEVALLHVQQERTQEIVVIGAMLPTVGGSGTVATGSGVDMTKGRVAQSIRAGDNTTGLRSITRMVGFDAGWELDIFGKNQRLLEATRDNAEAQMELRNAVLITVIADVARNYLEIRGLQFRLQIAREDIAAAQKTVDLLLTRFDRGLSNELDLTLARRQLATQQARVPELSGEISAAESRLAVLLGTYASDIAGEFQTAGKLPHLPERLRAGVPVDLLRRRPDIRAAERSLAAANAQVGVATADLFPTVALTAGLGLQRGAKQTPTSQTSHGPIWSFGPAAYWPLLDFGRLDALIDIQELHTREIYVDYRKTVITAVEEVDQAIKQYRYDVAQERALNIALTAARRAVDLAMERYERGVTDFLNVLDAQRQQYLLEDQHAVAAAAVGLEYVAFYKALGGGWEMYDDLPPIQEAQPAIIATVRRVVDGWR